MSPTLSLRDRHSGRPLRVLITRPADQAEQTAELVQQAGGEALVCPCLIAAPPVEPLAASLRQALQALSTAGGPRPVLAVTSRYAVLALADALRSQAPAQTLADALQGWFVAAVGPRTADALAQQGRPADRIAGEPSALESAAEKAVDATDEASSAAQLAALLVDLQQRQSPADLAPGKRVLFLRAAEARPTLPQTLRAAGFDVSECVAYRMVAASPDALEPMVQALTEARVDLVPFGSPRTVAIALSALGPQAAALLARTRVGAIGQTTAQALRDAGIRVDVVATQARFDSLLSHLVSDLLSHPVSGVSAR